MKWQKSSKSFQISVPQFRLQALYLISKTDIHFPEKMSYPIISFFCSLYFKEPEYDSQSHIDSN